MKVFKNRQEVVGYDVIEGPITTDQLLARAKAANQNIKEGKLKSIKQVREDFKTWGDNKDNLYYKE